MLHPSVLPALAGYAPQVRWLHDDFAYGRLLAELWAQPGDLCLVEHDVEVNQDTLAGFESCSHPWCSAPYWVRPGVVVDGLGCCRFREELRRMVPAPTQDLYWANVYTAYVIALHPLGLAPHRHAEVTHHHSC